MATGLDEELQPYIDGGRSGTLMIVFEDNSLGRVYIVDGVPVSARYKSLQGAEALDTQLSMPVATVKFHNNADLVRSTVLLTGASADQLQKSRPAAAPAPAEAQNAAREPQVATNPNAVMLTEVGRSRLAELLSEYIGPVAPLVMSDLPATVDVDSALSIVSQEIDNTRRAAEFIAAARRII
ncbi:MAG: hypothetical protein AAF402_14910 [Pseudomonadota bacterium]